MSPRKPVGNHKDKVIRTPARHRVREQIQQWILTGRRPAGTRLGQQELARRFGVAQGVVREALLELQISGLVETSDNRGACVGSVGPGMIIESVQIRGALEGLAVRLCCRRITREEIRRLEEHVRRIHQLAQENQFEQSGLQDRLFHQRLIEISGNRMLQRLSENFWVLGKITAGMGKDSKKTLEEHLAILKAIEQGREKQAELLMREHIGDLGDGIEKQIQKGPFSPKWILSVE
jgi:DNA-binding GntR family transcriptional regulator